MKKGQLKIYLFRHGETTHNRDGIFTGSIDAKLTLKGKNHAKIIAKILKRKKFQAAIHTKLSRSKETLKQVLKYHPECVLILEDNRITERNYGALQGMDHKKYIEKYGQGKYDEIHRGFYIRPPKGESFADVEKRVMDFIKDLKKFMKKDNLNVAISAHGNSIRLFRKIMEKTSVEETIKWSIPYDKVFSYSV